MLWNKVVIEQVFLPHPQSLSQRERGVEQKPVNGKVTASFIEHEKPLAPLSLWERGWG
jgi:hypothetical protein